MMRRLLIMGVVALGGCALPFAERAPVKQYTFVVLGVDGIPVARVITTDSTCPSIELDGVAQSMDIRAAPATVQLRTTRSDPTESKPSAFPVLVCEKAFGRSVARAAIDGRALPLPKANPRKIVVLGDTGCRIKTADNAFQACQDPREWPFAVVGDVAAAEAPDLVIHVGDYHYRENVCPAGNLGCANSPWGYGWDAWEADLFIPAKRLMAAAPWIVVRGNHESCARAGQGWWRFLDPRPFTAKQDCNEATNDPIGDYSEPYAVPLGSGMDADTQFIVFDSSLVGVRPLSPNDPMYINYHAQFERVFSLAERRRQTFVVNHHPILAFAPNYTQRDAPYPGNAALQSVLQSLAPTVLFPPNVQALLAGHIHTFEVVSFSSGQPAQFVTGTGGDLLDADLPSRLGPGATPAPGAIVSDIIAMSRFGYMTMERDGPGWRMIARDVNGAAIASCRLRERRATCER